MRQVILLGFLSAPLSAGGVRAAQAASPQTIQEITDADSREIDFVGIDFEEPTLRGELSIEMIAVKGEPCAGERYQLRPIIEAQETIATVTFVAVDESGTWSEPIAMAARPSGAPGDWDIVGLMTVPSYPFRIVMKGTTTDGHPFEKICRRLVRPGAGPPKRLTPLPGLSREDFEFLSSFYLEHAPQVLAEAEAFVAEHGAIRLVMPRTRLSNVAHTPLLSAAGNVIGLRVTYDAEFSQPGRYNPALHVAPEYKYGTGESMAVLRGTVTPLPREVLPPHNEAASGELRPSVLAYGADFIYEPRTVYHFSVELIPSYIGYSENRTKLCIIRNNLEGRFSRKRFGEILASTGPLSYRMSIGGRSFEARIQGFYGERTFYQSFVGEAMPDCPRPGNF